MASFNFADFSGLHSALQVRGALIDINQRYQNRSSRNPAKMAVYTPDGKVFASSFMSKVRSALAVPSHIRVGTILEYEDEQGNKISGLVVESPVYVKEKGIYVKPLSEEQVKRLIAENPTINRLRLDSKSVRSIDKINDDTNIPDAIADLTPFQKLLFWAIKEALIKRLLEWADREIIAKIKAHKKEIIDTFLWIYLLAIVIVFSILIFHYLHK